LARKILLADDSVTAQNMGRKILTDAGYDVVTVNNGSAALKRVGEHKPDLIVLDVYMPGYSGLEVCARLKDAPDTSRIPVLLTVGKLEPFKPEEANRVRADAFIVKPFEASELLSALTRLEDRMVPQADSARFSTTVSGIERFSGGDPAMRKVEADPEETGWKNRLRFPSKKKKEEPEPEPEEDFGTTPYRDFKKNAGKAAAKGSFAVHAAPAAGQEPGLVPDIPRDITPEELDALSELVAKLDGPIPAAENVAPLGDKIALVEAKQHEGKQEEVKPDAVPAAEVAQAAEQVVPEAVEAPPAVAEPVAEVAPAAVATEAAPASEEASPTAEKQEIPASAVEAASVEVAPQQASIDESEEPRFAAASAVEEVPSQEPQEFQVVASAEPSAVAEAVEAKAPEPETVQSEKQEVAEAPPVKASTEPDPVAESAPVPVEAAAPAPSAEELAEALRLLTPAQAGQTLAEAGAALAEELARGPSVGTRWVAETVVLSPEEASLSLEAEMFKTFATQREPEAVSLQSAAASAPVGHAEEEAAEAAVEAAETVAEAAPATTASIVEVHAPVPALTAKDAAAEAVPADSPAKSEEEAAPEEVTAVTFADAIRSDDNEGVAVNSAVAEGSGDESGGSEDMAKDAKGKGKWHQIHSTPEPAAKTDVVEAAKAEEAPKAMAAAASAEGTSEASAIASIVDSVLADLKPKIVEEIAKKLAKK